MLRAKLLLGLMLGLLLVLTQVAGAGAAGLAPGHTIAAKAASHQHAVDTTVRTELRAGMPAGGVLAPVQAHPAGGSGDTRALSSVKGARQAGNARTNFCDNTIGWSFRIDMCIACCK